jgi:hypothetical protein
MLQVGAHPKGNGNMATCAVPPDFSGEEGTMPPHVAVS